jgi:hypothetical protein
VQTISPTDKIDLLEEIFAHPETDIIDISLAILQSLIPIPVRFSNHTRLLTLCSVMHPLKSVWLRGMALYEQLYNSTTTPSPISSDYYDLCVTLKSNTTDFAPINMDRAPPKLSAPLSDKDKSEFLQPFIDADAARLSVVRKNGYDFVSLNMLL